MNLYDIIKKELSELNENSPSSKYKDINTLIKYYNKYNKPQIKLVSDSSTTLIVEEIKES